MRDTTNPTLLMLKAGHNVIDLAEERRLRAEPVMIQFVGFQAAPAAPPVTPQAHPAAQALFAGLMQGIAQREKDAALLDAGKRLAEAAQKGQPAEAPPEPPRKRYSWLRWSRRL